MLAEDQQRDDVAGLDQAAHVVVAADSEVDVAAGHVGVDLRTALVALRVQGEALGGDLKAHAVNAGGGQHGDGYFIGVGSGILLQIGEGLDAVLVHLLLGAGQHVDGVNQNILALKLILEVEVHIVHHILDEQGLGAEQEGVAVGGLLVSVGGAGHAAAAGLVADFHGNAQLILQQGGHGTDGAVSAAAEAPGAHDLDLALKLPIIRKSGDGGHHEDACHHHDDKNQSDDFLHRGTPPKKYFSQAAVPPCGVVPADSRQNK